ncbi:hypothetical protein GWI33_011605, partial [Rhynchophorus ferrugineus]
MDICKRKGSITNPEHDSDVLKKRLGEVLSEGLLDSILPYLAHNSTSLRKVVSCTTVKNPEKTLQNSSSSNDKLIRRRSSDSSSSKLSQLMKTDSEVEIHVCDEVKNMKRTFVCNQKLLVEKMGYFAEVTLGQKLEEM